MRVVFINNVKGIGRVGDVKNVNDGYARNFLLPRGLARPVSEGLLKDVEATKTQKLEAAEMAQHEVEALAADISGTRVELSSKANAKGTLFAAIPEIMIKGRKFTLPVPIKTTGDHPVVLELTPDITASIVVSVSAR
jgi:large subunit ribosomal protein L9